MVDWISACEALMMTAGAYETIKLVGKLFSQVEITAQSRERLEDIESGLESTIQNIEKFNSLKGNEKHNELKNALGLLRCTNYWHRRSVPKAALREVYLTCMRYRVAGLEPNKPDDY
ncbi:MAG: hypothetical protein V1729_00390 [Candidatus Woesearchaeota archaeon]